MLRFLLPTVLLLIACRKDSTEAWPGGRADDWVAMKPGIALIYAVDSVSYYTVSGKPDTIRFEHRETVDTLFPDNLNEPAARIRIDRRKDSSYEWGFHRMIYVKAGREYVEKVEDNRRFIKLSFPVTAEAVWDMNARNDLQPAFLYYGDSLYRTLRIAGLTFDSCLEVRGQDVVNNLEENRYREIYGRKTGLLFRHITDKVKQGGRTNGYEIIYRLKEKN